MKNQRGKNQRGFTLIEIAIVLVIVGLLLGAVLKGQELVFNTKLKSTYNLSRETAAAMYAYQDRYRVLPGDDNQATVRFPGMTPAPINGNNNGIMLRTPGQTCAAATGNNSENCQALYHMRLAGFLAGQGNTGLRTAFGGLASPSSSSTILAGTGNNPVLGMEAAGLTHKIMGSIDTSFDDGNPATGSVRCATLTTYNYGTPDAAVPAQCLVTM